MTTTVILAIIIFAISMAAMAVGWLLSGQSLRGSCGGLAGMKDRDGNPICDACSNPMEECSDFREQVASQAEARQEQTV